MRSSSPGLLPLFRSQTQLAILGALFVGGKSYWNIASLAERLQLPTSSTSREVGNLVRAGIVTATKEGRNTVVGPNWDLPWARALTVLLDQTIGPQALLTEALAGVEGVREAWIFGSWAAREAGQVGPAPHDIDLLLVGEGISQFDLVDVLSAVADRAGVEVNPYVVSTEEWACPEKGSFVEGLKGSPLVRLELGPRV